MTPWPARIHVDGTLAGSTSACPTEPSTGRRFDVRIFDRALTAGEVGDLAAVQSNDAFSVVRAADLAARAAERSPVPGAVMPDGGTTPLSSPPVTLATVTSSEVPFAAVPAERTGFPSSIGFLPVSVRGVT